MEDIRCFKTISDGFVIITFSRNPSEITGKSHGILCDNNCLSMLDCIKKNSIKKTLVPNVSLKACRNHTLWLTWGLTQRQFWTRTRCLHADGFFKKSHTYVTLCLFLQYIYFIPLNNLHVLPSFTSFSQTFKVNILCSSEPILLLQSDVIPSEYIQHRMFSKMVWRGAFKIVMLGNTVIVSEVEKLTFW